MRRAKIKCPLGIAASRFRSGVPQNDAGLEYNKSIPWSFHLPPLIPLDPLPPPFFYDMVKIPVHKTQPLDGF